MLNAIKAQINMIKFSAKIYPAGMWRVQVLYLLPETLPSSLLRRKFDNISAIFQMFILSPCPNFMLLSHFLQVFLIPYDIL